MNHFIYLILLCSCLQSGSDPALQQSSHSPLDRPIHTNTYNPRLVESAIFIATNATRKTHGLCLLASHDQLRESAIKTSREQADNQALSHTSINPGRRHLNDRIKLEGVDLVNTIIAENLGVDYILQIAERYFYIDTSTEAPIPIDAETHRPINSYTYRQFGEAMVNHWMASPAHRKNILCQHFEWMGVGAAIGQYQGYPAIYVTQHFSGRITPLQNNGHH